MVNGLRLNHHDGRNSAIPGSPLSPLRVVIDGAQQRLVIDAHTVTLRDTFQDLRALETALAALYHVLPCLLTVTLVEPQLVRRVEGTVGGVRFDWILEKWNLSVRPTSQRLQEQAAILGWRSMNTVAVAGRERLVAAIHYFRQASRLRAVARQPGEFLAETLLNLAKVLEVLFPPSGDTGSIDAARTGLSRLGYSQEQIEGDFVPALAIRSEVDVAHPLVGHLDVSDLAILHGYAEDAELAVRDLLERLLARVGGDPTLLTPYIQGPARPGTRQALRRLREARAAQRGGGGRRPAN